MIKKRNILVIENREFWRDKIQEVLESAGYQVTATTDPNEGINLSKKKRFDLILLDYALKAIKSIVVLREIVKYNKKNKVIVTTTHPSIKDAVRYLRSGAFDYVEKPYNYEKIKVIVDTEIAGKQYSSN